jgi:hypothetical protein
MSVGQDAFTTVLHFFLYFVQLFDRAPSCCKDLYGGFLQNLCFKKFFEKSEPKRFDLKSKSGSRPLNVFNKHIKRT